MILWDSGNKYILEDVMYFSIDEGWKTIGINIEFKIRDILLGIGVVSLLALAFAAGFWM